METKKSIYQKIYNLQSEVGVLSKDLKNPFYKSKYFDINQLIGHLSPLLTKYKLLLLQPIIDSKLITKIIDIDSGEEISSSFIIPEFNDPQKTGSAITYYRRYTLQSLLGLQAKDDDGNKAISESNIKKNIDNEIIYLDEKEFNKILKLKDSKRISDGINYWTSNNRQISDEYLKTLNNRIKTLNNKIDNVSIKQ